METYLLLLIILIVLLVLLWYFRKGGSPKPPDDENGDELIPRPKSDFVEPPRQEVRIRFDEQRNMVLIEPANLILAPDKQAAWSGVSGKIEIRFNPGDTPFAGSGFTSARGGTSLSGIPRRNATMDRPFNYLVLFTTSDGRLFSQTATVVVSRQGEPGKIG